MKRGFLIGEIIDDLSEVQRDLENRSALGIYDLNKYIEDYFREFFNKLYGVNLLNLNVTRSNEPGLDLGDKSKSCAYQITSTKKLKKIKETLSKITDEQKKAYTSIYIFIAGKKQGSYSLSEGDKCDIDFDINKNIIDINDVLKDVIVMDFDKLVELHEFSKLSTSKVRIELEIPTKNGGYATSVKNFFESIPTPTIGSGKKISGFWNKQDQHEEFSVNEFVDNIEYCSTSLAKLPRITREFLATVIERVLQVDGIDESGMFKISTATLKRLPNGYDYKGDLHILEERGMCSYDEPEYRNGPDYFRFSIPSKSDLFPFAVIEYYKSISVSLHKPLVALDFSDA